MELSDRSHKSCALCSALIRMRSSSFFASKIESTLQVSVNGCYRQLYPKMASYCLSVLIQVQTRVQVKKRNHKNPLLVLQLGVAAKSVVFSRIPYNRQCLFVKSIPSLDRALSDRRTQPTVRVYTVWVYGGYNT
jgi:hypothetical protein